ncbi:MAG: NAD-dependent epimerase/dehydratase family protein [Kiloniellaceae bacterium]
MPRVLVTGANGFVGAAVCRHLLAQRWQVRGSLRHDSAVAPEGVEAVVSGPLDGTTDWTSVLTEVNSVVHCAARVHVSRESETDPLAAFSRVNVEGSRRLAEQAAAAGVGCFVYLSSIGAAAAESKPDGAEPDGASPYQKSKLEAEAALRQSVGNSGMVLVMLRPPLIYGPGAPGNFARLVRLVASGLPLPLAGLENRRSLLYLGNLIAAIESALACRTSPAAPLPLADGEDLSTPELTRRIGRACGRPARLFPVPRGLLHLAGRLLGRERAIAALTGSLTIDNSAIHKALGWTPRFSVDEGLAITFQKQRQRQRT